MLVPMLLSGVLFDVAFTLIRRFLAHENVTQPHRGHLYQVAQRSGVAAVAVTLIHWGFAAFGGLCAVLFLKAAGDWKLVALYLTVPPQLAWLVFVVWYARRNGLERWG
jgi:UDP-GlcNAc:undecaprenyl-phosphate GlcNAc-1-phosphate transferase